MNHSNENKHMINFYDIISSFQIINKRAFNKYLTELWKDLSLQSPDILKGLSREVFYSYFNYPEVINKHLFTIFTKKGQYINLEQFITGMNNLYSHNFDILVNLVFDLYDYDRDNMISKEDILLILSYIQTEPLIKNEINEELNKYALKTDLDVIKIYGDSVAEDTSMSVDGVKYDTASEAINAVPDGGTVKMSGGLGVGEVINVDKKLTLDMNNAVIVDNEKTPVTVGINGNLTLSGDGSVECNKNGKPAISNNGTLTIENGNITRTVDEKGNTYYTMVNHGNVTINGGIFQAPREVSSMIENGYWDYNSGNAESGYMAGVNAQYPELTVNGGTFINSFYAIKNDDASKLTINNGMFYGTILHNGIEMIINGGHFTTTDGFYPLSIRNLSDDLNPAKTVINGGIFDGNCKTIIKNSGEKELDIQVKGGKFILPVEAQYIAEGYEQKLVNGYYEVTKKA